MIENELDQMERELSELHTKWVIASIAADEAKRAYEAQRLRVGEAVEAAIRENMRQL